MNETTFDAIMSAIVVLGILFIIGSIFFDDDGELRKPEDTSDQ